MQHKTTLVLGVVLVAVGLIGLTTVWVLDATGTSLRGTGTFASAGERIYYTGLDASGRAIPRTSAVGGMTGLRMMYTAACVDCHREDGRGSRLGMMFGSADVPDIRYPVLTSAHTEDGESIPAWSDRDIERAIREGIEPNGERLKAPMPRWNMTDQEVTDVISYLKELGAR